MPAVDVARRAEIGRLKRSRTRAQLIAAARQVMVDKGHEATIDDFIAAAGVARGTFYNYFKSREEIVLSIKQDLTESLQTDVTVALKGVTGPAMRIGEIMKVCIRKAAADPIWGELMIRLISVGPIPNNPIARRFSAELKSGREAGLFTFESFSAAEDIVKGATLMAMRSVVRKDEPASHAEQVVFIVMRSLGMPLDHSVEDIVASNISSVGASEDRNNGKRRPRLAKQT